MIQEILRKRVLTSTQTFVFESGNLPISGSYIKKTTLLVSNEHTVRSVYDMYWSWQSSWLWISITNLVHRQQWKVSMNHAGKDF